MSSFKIAHKFNDKIRSNDVKLEENITFQSLLLSENILNGLIDSGFEKPSPIQLKAIPLGRCGIDLIVKSKSGTGKTLVFSIIALEMVNCSKNQLQVLIIAPTREIAVQSVDVIRNVGCCIDNLKVESFIGGLPIEDDINKIQNCHIAIGAPGRIKHLLTLDIINTNMIKLFVLDEADLLMDENFQNDINYIFNCLPKQKQVLAISATYADKLDHFLSNYMLSSTYVSAEIESPVLLGLKQFVSILPRCSNSIKEMKFKNEELFNILSCVSFTQCLIFTNYQVRTESLCSFLKGNRWHAEFLSSNLSQTKRLDVINKLKEFKCRILITTDLAARGIDAANVDLIINYDLPIDPTTYLHRMGRAGRFGSQGVCITITIQDGNLKEFKNVIGTIGGETFPIYVLPYFKYNKTNIDLLNMDINSLEKIYGVITDINLSKAFYLKKKSIINRQYNKINNKKNNDKSSDMKESTTNPISELSSVSSSISSLTKTYDSNDSIESISSIASTSLSKENFHFKPLKTSIIINNEIDKNNLIQEQINKNDSIIVKNEALFNVTKLLDSTKTNVNDDIVQSINNYLINVKSDDLLNLNNDEKNNYLSDVENIFFIGYNYAIDRTKRNLFDCLSNEDLIKFKEFCIREKQIYDNDDDDDGDAAAADANDYDDDDCNYNPYEEPVKGSDFTYDDHHPDLNKDYDDECLNRHYGPSGSSFPYDNLNQNNETNIPGCEWKPVDSDKKKKRDNVNTNESKFFNKDSEPVNAHFTDCFNQCSDILWYNGMNFDNSDSFDLWYNEWLEQLKSVTTYVQQNIYVKEMSDYQKRKNNI